MKNIILYIIRMRYIRKPIFKLLYKISPKRTYNFINKKCLTYGELEKWFGIEDLCYGKIYFD